MKRFLLACAFAGLSFTAHAQDKLPVVASFSILGDIVGEVGGDRVAVRTLVGPDGDAHVFQPSPQDAAVVAAARVLVINGLGFEGWIERLTGTTRFAGVTTVASQGIDALSIEDSEHEAGHDDHDGHEDDHGHDHRHKQAGHRHHGGLDPHAWQDPRLVRTYVANIVAGLSKADPANAAHYRARGDDYLARLDATDAWIAQQIAAIPEAKRKVITSHDAFGYYARRYGVQFLSVSGVSTDAEAAAGDVGSIIRVARKEGVKAVFVENISNPKLSQQVARETGATLGARLYSDALSRAGGPAADYLSLLRYNTTQLVQGMRQN